MASNSKKSFLLLLVIFITFISSTTSTPKIGVTINHYPSSITPQTPLSTIINRHNFTAVRLLDPTPHLLRSFSNSSTTIHLFIPNSYVPALATNRSIAALWVLYHVVPFYPDANITAISVGSNTISTTLTLLAIRHIQYTLHQLDIHEITVSTSVSVIPLLTSFFPPSSSKFIEPHKKASVIPLLEFLKDENSSFFVNLHPYDLYRFNHEIVLGFALFQDGPFNYRDDPHTGVRYHNLFDVMVDAVLAAMSREGYGDIPLIITETGWPSSSGGSEKSDANKVYAEKYLRGLMDHLKYGGTSTLMKKRVSEVFIYELLDDGTSSIAPKWGILHSNFSTKYRDLTLESEDVEEVLEVTYNDRIGNKTVKKWRFLFTNMTQMKHGFKPPMAKWKWVIGMLSTILGVLCIVLYLMTWVVFAHVFVFRFPLPFLGNVFEDEDELDFDGVQEDGVAVLNGEEQGAGNNNGDAENDQEQEQGDDNNGDDTDDE